MLSETKGILKKAGFTLMAIAIYLLGSQIPVPAVKLTHHYQQLMHESSVRALAVMSGLRVKPFTLSATGRSQVPSSVAKESIATLSESQAAGLLLVFPPPQDARAAIAMANNNNFFTINNLMCFDTPQIGYLVVVRQSPIWFYGCKVTHNS